MALYAFDGTWNDSTAPDEKRDLKKDTNVHRFRLSYREPDHYVNGVGTRYGFIGKIVGGAIGAGAQKRIDEQFDALKKAFQSGDQAIDIVGYSRGAAIARMFVHHIDLNYEELTVDGEALAAPPAVRFLGLFDTVASFGVPWNAKEGDFKADIPDFVEHTYHAMALDETRETFGIERCVGNRDKITEVWFRGGHGDIGGNATFQGRQGERGNRERSDIALHWMLHKARACGLPVSLEGDAGSPKGTDVAAPVTSLKHPVEIGNAGTLSRRIHSGDLVHYSVEQSELTRGIDGRLLRRIDRMTRIEDQSLEQRAEPPGWAPPLQLAEGPDNVKPAEAAPSVVQLSLRRYPFDVLPARTWSAWMRLWSIDNPGLDADMADEFWAPSDADRALAWEVYVELQTRIATQELPQEQGDDATALRSIASLFDVSRKSMCKHGVGCANAGALITAFLNEKVRGFTAKWHKVSIEEAWEKTGGADSPRYREELAACQQQLRHLAGALSQLADARL